MMTITYPVHNGIYVNMTNRCPCACTFCLRHQSAGVYGSEPLWLDREPTVKEVCDNLDTWDLSKYNEVVFCGYGEPTERLYDLLEVAKHIKAKSDIKIRINTNGLADLIWKESTAPKLKGLIDTVSVSLNATMLKFTKECTQYVPSVVMTVVDVVTTKQEQELCRKICESVGATLRVRAYEG